MNGWPMDYVRSLAISDYNEIAAVMNEEAERLKALTNRET